MLLPILGLGLVASKIFALLTTLCTQAEYEVDFGFWPCDFCENKDLFPFCTWHDMLFK